MLEPMELSKRTAALHHGVSLRHARPGEALIVGADSRANETASPCLDCLHQATPMQVQRVCVLRVWPEQLSAKLLIAVHAQNSTQLPRLIVVPKCILREHGQHPSLPLADRLKRRS